MTSLARLWPLGVGGVLCLGLVALQNAAMGRGRLDPVAGAGTALLSPLQSGLNGAGAYFSDIGRVIVHRDDLASENTRLRARIVDLEGQNARLSRLQRENVELRKLLKMPAPLPGQNIGADVVAATRGDVTRRLTLGAGSRAGVAVKDVVYCAQGLVGQISSVGPWTSVVTPLVDRDGGAGAFVSRSGAQGLVVGNGSDVPKMLYLPFDADVRVGDLLLSSGAGQSDGAIYPRGIVIGHILKIEKDRAYSRQNAYVAPAVIPENLGAVWIHIDSANP
ncbi:cell shape-determining protein MreC [Abditibacteriota bacterium]|nr:cell shape-determining protein MreC [Abditibacteriota bacterium]